MEQLFVFRNVALAIMLLCWAATSALAQNLLPSTVQWDLLQNDHAQASGERAGTGYTVRVASPDGPVSVNLIIRNVHLVDGASYHLHVMISSSVPARATMAVYFGDGPARAVGLLRTVSTGPQLAPFDADFTARGPDAGATVINFFLGGAAATYAIMNASLVPSGTVVPAPSTQMRAITAGDSSAAAGPAGPGWNIQYSGKGHAGLIASGMGGSVIYIDQVDGDASHVALTNPSVPLPEGTSYTLQFRGRSALQRPIFVHAGDRPGLGPSSTDRVVVLTPTWQEYSVTLDKRAGAAATEKIAFLLGVHTGAVQLDDIVVGQRQVGDISQGASNPPRSLRRIASWDLATIGSASASVDAAPGGATVDIARVDGSPAHVALQQDGVCLLDGARYELRFKAKATVARRVPIVAEVDSGQGHRVGLDGAIRITPLWQDYDLKFTAVRPEPNHSRIAFLLGGAAGAVELSDVALRVVDDPQPTGTISPP